MRFLNRSTAGQQLAQLLRSYQREAPLILALPRGGVPVGYEVARLLRAPLDVFVVRKLGAPSQPEVGLGAIAEGGVVYLDEPTLVGLDVTDAELEEILAREEQEVERRASLYRGGRAAPEVKDRTVLVIDDGVATGGTARAALRAIRRRGPRRLIFAVPVGAASTLDDLQEEADEVVSLSTPENLVAVGCWYDDFQQVSDAEVLSSLERTRTEQGRAHP